MADYPLTIAIADDQPVVLKGMGDVLQIYFPQAEIYSKTSGQDLVNFVRNSKKTIDVVVTDTDMETRGAGIDAIRSLQEHGYKGHMILTSTRDVSEDAQNLGVPYIPKDDIDGLIGLIGSQKARAA